MKKINYLDCPCVISGIYGYKKGDKFHRLPENVVDEMPDYYKELSTHPVGLRIRLRTDSDKFKVKIKLRNVYADRGMSYYQANVGAIYVGERKSSAYYGIVTANNSYDENEIYGEYSLPEGVNEITIFTPRNPEILDIEFEIDDNAEIFEPTPYTFEGGKPIVFYGSSITENGHTSSQNAYTALISRWFDADYYNLGFSGSARGEEAMARYISKIDCSIFVYDYDHNAPSAEHLANTHEKFFKIFREAQPTTPVIMMTKPYDDFPETKERHDIIYRTYINAGNAGDENVYFIDGLTYFPDRLRETCTTDRTHPNDLGHYFMAEKVEEVIKKITK